MIRVLLISVTEGAVSYGLRSLSAVLKEAGFPVKMVFLPRETEGYRNEGFKYFYPAKILDQITDLAKDFDLVGISLMSNHYSNAVEITRHLHKTTHALVIWGGIHPTIRPDECLADADLVCVGEGEDALLELAHKLNANQGYSDIENIWYRQEGTVIRTPLRPLVVDLDRFPYPDYDLEDHYILHHGMIQPMRADLLYYYLRWPYDSEQEPTYITMMSRGCTWNCTYCNNNALRMVYHNDWRVRRRSVPNFIGELRNIEARYPGIKCFKIEDDVFLDDNNTLREFAHLYKQNITTPLFVAGFQPTMVTDENVALLVDAGMKGVRMGIQTGSIDILHGVYKRPGSIEQLRKASMVFHKFKQQIDPPMYDLILDNPWESEEDRLKTINLVLDIPGPYVLDLYSLTFYPGTALYERARSEGLLKDEVGEVYQKNYLEMRPIYTNYVMKLLQFSSVPHWLVRFLLKDQLRKRNLVIFPRFVYKIMSFGRLLKTGLKALLRRDYGAFYRAIQVRKKKPARVHDSRWLREDNLSPHP